MDIYAFRQIGQTLASPIVQSIILLAIALLIGKVIPKFRKTKCSLVSLSILWLLLCSQPFFSLRLLAPLETFAGVIHIDSPQLANSNATYILACFFDKQVELPTTGGWNECALTRLVEGAIIYHKHKTPIYISGGDFLPNKKLSYTQSAKQLLVRLGVDENDIFMVSKGVNTLEEMQHTYKQLPSGQVNIVSSATHMRRIALFDEYIRGEHSIQNSTELPINLLYFPVDHIITDSIPSTPAIPRYHSIENTERAIYEYIAISAHRLAH